MEIQGHVPVLYRRTLELLALKPGAAVLDGTLGGGGHARGMLEAIQPGGVLVGVDKDAAAIARCAARLGKWRDSVALVQSDFKDIDAVEAALEENKIAALDAVLLDLGVSSYQLDEAERGFSYQADAPLDMRMDRDNPLTAADVVNGYGEKELARVIRDYGEERWAARIAQFIVNERGAEPIETTGRLVSVIKKAVPKGARQDGPHPAKRTFQAIRIEVNGELAGLKEAVAAYAELLKPGGRIAVITFHSLEDRIIKQEFRRLEHPCECPKDFPVCVCGKVPLVKAVTRKPVTPDETELEENPRARSAKLRVAERI